MLLFIKEEEEEEVMGSSSTINAIFKSVEDPNRKRHEDWDSKLRILLSLNSRSSKNTRPYALRAF